MNNLLVMKFGGTSMGSAERIRVAATICAEQKARRPVLAVVSAMSGFTDLLLGALRHAEADDEAGIESSIQSLSERHEKTCHELLREPARCDRAMAGIRELISDFRRIAHGMLMLGDRPPRSVDEAIAIGERLSALMIAEYLEASDVSARAINAADVIVTDAVFGNATPIMEVTRRKAAAVIAPLLASGILPVVTGLNGATADGRSTTLGRGGSDFSASILAAALDASELWIWTDVDGIMTADPRLVPDAKILAEITYSEAAELAYAGAKVLHPRTLAPLVERKIPVWSKNSFAPENPGTRIVPKLGAGNSGARAVTSMANVALVSLEPASSGVGGVHIMARSLDALDRANVEVLAISSSSYRQSFCFLVRNEELETATQAIEAAR